MKKQYGQNFQRAAPLATSVLEKPMFSWASGKIKRIYDGYDTFCREITSLLDGSENGTPVQKEQNTEMIEEFEFLWQPLGQKENIQQLLTLLSDFYKVGLVTVHSESGFQIKSYFVEESPGASPLPPLLMGRTLEPMDFSVEKTDFKPLAMGAESFVKKLGLSQLDWREDALAFHFWLYPEEAIGLLLLSDKPEPQRRTLVLKTQALIQRHFYD